MNEHGAGADVYLNNTVSWELLIGLDVALHTG
jgi:hypothetical protein